MDEFKENLTIAELKTNNLRETLSRLQDHSSALLVFSLQWKDLEAHYESLRNVLSQREKEVRAQEDSVRCRLRCLEEQCRELEEKQSELGILDESIDVLMKEFEVAERKFSERVRLEIEAKGKEIEKELEVLENVRREIAERLAEIEEREERVERVFEEMDRKVKKEVEELAELWKETEDRDRKTELKGKELEKKQKELEELRTRIQLRESEIKFWDRELENKEKELEESRRKIKTREEEIDCKDRVFGERSRKYEEKEVKLEERRREVEKKDRESKIKYKKQSELLEIRKKEVEKKMENVRLDEEKLKVRCGEIESREGELDERREEVDAMGKRLEGLAEKLESDKRELEEREQRLKQQLDQFTVEKGEFDKWFKKAIVREGRLLDGIEELKIGEEKLAKRNRELDVAKKRLNIATLAMLRSEEPRKRRADAAACMVVQHCVVMDGRELQIFLNELGEEHGAKRDTVCALLRFCSDPAKLVLDALVGFYPPHLKHGDGEFEASVVRSSCLLLLEQLMEIGPIIKPRVKGEAMKLSFDWITRMKVDSEHCMEVLAFLELVCAYGLADAFDENELSNYAETVAHYRQIPKLRQALGLGGRIPC